MFALSSCVISGHLVSLAGGFVFSQFLKSCFRGNHSDTSGLHSLKRRHPYINWRIKHLALRPVWFPTGKKREKKRKFFRSNVTDCRKFIDARSNCVSIKTTLRDENTFLFLSCDSAFFFSPNSSLVNNFFTSPSRISVTFEIARLPVRILSIRKTKCELKPRPVANSFIRIRYVNDLKLLMQTRKFSLSVTRKWMCFQTAHYTDIDDSYQGRKVCSLIDTHFHILSPVTIWTP